MQYIDASNDTNQYMALVQLRRGLFLQRCSDYHKNLERPDYSQKFEIIKRTPRNKRGQITGPVVYTKRPIPRRKGYRASPRLQTVIEGTHEFFDDWDLLCMGGNLKQELLGDHIPKSLAAMNRKWRRAIKTNWNALIAEIQLGGNRYKQANRMLTRCDIIWDGDIGYRRLDANNHLDYENDSYGHSHIVGVRFFHSEMNQPLLNINKILTPVPVFSVNGAALDFACCLRRHPELYRYASTLVYGDGTLMISMCP